MDFTGDEVGEYVPSHHKWWATRQHGALYRHWLVEMGKAQ